MRAHSPPCEGGECAPTQFIHTFSALGWPHQQNVSTEGAKDGGASPYMHVGFVRQPHGLTGCHAERFIELRDIDKRAIHAPLRWRVDIAEQAAAQEFFAAFVEPAERVAEKEAL